MPILLVLSENDKLVDTEISYEMAEILGAKEDHITVYKESQLEKERSTSENPRIVALSVGGHYSFVNHPKVVNSEIIHFLASVINNNDHQESSKTSEPLSLEQDNQVSQPILTVGLWGCHMSDSSLIIAAHHVFKCSQIYLLNSIPITVEWYTHLVSNIYLRIEQYSDCINCNRQLIISQQDF